jgi:hypothetical protein
MLNQGAKANSGLAWLGDELGLAMQNISPMLSAAAKLGRL